MTPAQESDAARRQRRRAKLDALKATRGGCEEILDDGTRCGWNRHPAGLQWDHRESKEHSHSQAFNPSWAWARILAEVAKCDLVCACCHAIRTATRGYGGGAPAHGKTRTAVVRGEFPGTPRLPIEECRNGHLYSEETTYIRPDGGRRCRLCRRDRKARYRHKPKG